MATRCVNCGSDLSVLRMVACCEYPMKDMRFPFPELPGHIEAMQSEIARLQLALTAMTENADRLEEACKGIEFARFPTREEGASIREALAAHRKLR